MKLKDKILINKSFSHIICIVNISCLVYIMLPGCKFSGVTVQLWYMHIHMHTYVHLINLVYKREIMNLKECRERCMGGL